MNTAVQSLKTVTPDENKTMDFLKGAGFNARYNLTTNTQATSKSSYFSSFVKYFVTDKVEIKTMNNLPVFLLHKKYNIDQYA